MIHVRVPFLSKSGLRVLVLARVLNTGTEFDNNMKLHQRMDYKAKEELKAESWGK